MLTMCNVPSAHGFGAIHVIHITSIERLAGMEPFPPMVQLLCGVKLRSWTGKRGYTRLVTARVTILSLV